LARRRHLPNAPIVEAVIDLRVRLKPDFNLKDLRDLATSISKDYPTCKERNLIAGSFEIKGDKPINTIKDQGIVGYLCEKADRKDIVQFRKDGFTFSRMKPYTNWDSVYNEAKRLWNLYLKKTHPIVIDRVAVRYINRFDLPIDTDVRRYLKSGPNIPKRISQEYEEFFDRVVISEKELKAAIIQTITKGSSPGYINYILDIDAFSTNTKELDDKQLWEVISKLRVLKNHIFFNLITEKAVRELKWQ